MQKDLALWIQAPSAGSPCHLHKLTRIQNAAPLPIKFHQIHEEYRLGGHVQADGEGLGGEDDGQQALQSDPFALTSPSLLLTEGPVLGKEQLHQFAQNRQHAAVMHSYATQQQLPGMSNLS